MTLITCQHCNKEIESSDYRKKFCNRNCKEAYRAKQKRIAEAFVPETRSCVLCGTNFLAKRPDNVYCSGVCGTKDHYNKTRTNRKTITKVCSICSKEFIARNKQQVTCGPECSKKRRYPSSYIPVGLPGAKPKSVRRHRHLISRYKISLDEYNALLLKQNNSCAICKRSSESLGYDLVVDHCHSTDKIRGLLCHKCNTGLGALGDSPDSLQIALNYLQQNLTNQNESNTTPKM